MNLPDRVWVYTLQRAVCLVGSSKLLGLDIANAESYHFPTIDDNLRIKKTRQEWIGQLGGKEAQNAFLLTAADVMAIIIIIFA